MIAVLATISSQSRLNRALILTPRGRDTLLKRTNDVHMRRFAGHFAKTLLFPKAELDLFSNVPTSQCRHTCIAAAKELVTKIHSATPP